MEESATHESDGQGDPVSEDSKEDVSGSKQEPDQEVDCEVDAEEQGETKRVQRKRTFKEDQLGSQEENKQATQR